MSHKLALVVAGAAVVTVGHLTVRSQHPTGHWITLIEPEDNEF